MDVLNVRGGVSRAGAPQWDRRRPSAFITVESQRVKEGISAKQGPLAPRPSTLVLPGQRLLIITFTHLVPKRSSSAARRGRTAAVSHRLTRHQIKTPEHNTQGTVIK